MICRQEQADNGRLHLIVSLTAEEIDEQLDRVVEEVKETEDLPLTLLEVDVKEFCAHNTAQNHVRSRVMQLFVPHALAETGITPVSQLVFLTKESVEKDRDFEYIISVVPTPSIELSSYDPVNAFTEELEVSKSEIEEEIERLVSNDISLTPKAAGEGIAPGDAIELEVASTRDGAEYEQLTAKKRLYQLGEEFLPPEFDENLLGLKKGESKQFTIPVKEGGAPIEVAVTIHGIYEEHTPTPTDEWAQKKYPGVGGLDGLRERIYTELLERRTPEYEDARADDALTQLSRRLVSSVPENVFDARFAEIYRNFCRELQSSYGQDIEEYFYNQGINERQFKEEMALDVRNKLMQGFALDAYARHHELTPDESEYQMVLTSLAPGDEEQIRSEYLLNGRGYILDEAARRNVALKHLLDNAKS